MAATDFSQSKHRPDRAEALLSDRRAYPDWPIYNWRHRRFFLVGAERAIGLLRIPHTAMGEYVERAAHTIALRTDWPAQFPGDYQASKTQLYPGKIEEPKLFEKAATLLVAFEHMAEEKLPDFNVYEQISIEPAFYFVDDFTPERLRALTAAYDTLSRERKIQIALGLGATPAADFQDIVTRYLRQPHHSGLLRELTTGHSITRTLGEALVTFVERVFDGRQTLGPVRTCGADDAYAPELGQKDAARSLRISRRPPEPIETILG